MTIRWINVKRQVSGGALRAAFHEAVEDYLDTCGRIGKEPQKAYADRKVAGPNQ